MALRFAHQMRASLCLATGRETRRQLRVQVRSRTTRAAVVGELLNAGLADVGLAEVGFLVDFFFASTHTTSSKAAKATSTNAARIPRRRLCTCERGKGRDFFPAFFFLKKNTSTGTLARAHREQYEVSL